MDARITLFAVSAAIIITARRILIEDIDNDDYYKKLFRKMWEKLKSLFFY